MKRAAQRLKKIGEQKAIKEQNKIKKQEEQKRIEAQEEQKRIEAQIEEQKRIEAQIKEQIEEQKIIEAQIVKQAKIEGQRLKLRSNLHYICRGVDNDVTRSCSRDGGWIKHTGPIYLGEFYRFHLLQVILPDLANLIFGYLPPMPSRQCRIRIDTECLDVDITEVHCQMVIEFPCVNKIIEACEQMYNDILSSILPEQFDKKIDPTQIQDKIEGYMTEFREHPDIDAKNPVMIVYSSSVKLNYGEPLRLLCGPYPYMMVTKDVPNISESAIVPRYNICDQPGFLHEVTLNEHGVTTCECQICRPDFF